MGADDATASADASTDGDALLVVDDLVKTFGGLVAVDGASFDVERESITGLIGPNGAGKSTLFDCITGVHGPESGSVHLNGDEIQGLSPTEVARCGVGRTFQTPKTFRGMTVRENLAFAATNQTGERALGPLLRSGTVRSEEHEVQARVDETLAHHGPRNRPAR
jgi:branched-chain amino acid transport system ATP-binding protein